MRSTSAVNPDERRTGLLLSQLHQEGLQHARDSHRWYYRFECTAFEAEHYFLRSLQKLLKAYPPLNLSADEIWERLKLRAPTLLYPDPSRLEAERPDLAARVHAELRETLDGVSKVILATNIEIAGALRTTIHRQVGLERRRHQRSQKDVSLTEITESKGPTVSPIDSLEEAENQEASERAMNRALRKLKPRPREIIETMIRSSEMFPKRQNVADHFGIEYDALSKLLTKFKNLYLKELKKSGHNH